MPQLGNIGVICACVCLLRQEGEKLDKEALMREAISGQMKERQDLERKLQTQVRPDNFISTCNDA